MSTRLLVDRVPGILKEVDFFYDNSAVVRSIVFRAVLYVYLVDVAFI